jgi:hypothetical protein
MEAVPMTKADRGDGEEDFDPAVLSDVAVHA